MNNSLPLKGKIILGIIFLFISLINSQGQEINISNNPASDKHPNFSPSGKKIIFESDRSGKWGIYEMNLINGITECLICDEYNNRIPSYSRSEKEIIFESDRSGIYKAYQFSKKDGKTSQLIPSNIFSFNQNWVKQSNDGKYVLFSSDSSANSKWNIYMYFLKDQSIKAITSGKQQSLYASWIDRDQIIYFSRTFTEGLKDDIVVTNLKSKENKILISGEQNCFVPVSWNETFVLFAQSIPNGRPEIFHYNISSKNLTQLTFNSEGDTEPCISKDGKMMSWTGFRNGNFEIMIQSLD